MSRQFVNKFLGTPSDPNAGQRKTKHVLQNSNRIHISGSEQLFRKNILIVKSSEFNWYLYNGYF